MNGTKSSVERRKWQRLPLAIPVFVRSRDGNSKEMLEFTTALNVSAGGMLLAARKISPANSEIRLEIPSAPVSALAMPPKASRGIRARVLRSTPAEGYNLLGLKFSHPLVRPLRRNKSKKRKAVSLA
jgi:c-di-GMP-binding flagellar brake protein YcgR